MSNLVKHYIFLIVLL